MALSTRSQTRAVSSIRVPALVRTCRRNWPLSVAGKKSRPSHGTSRKAAAQSAKKRRHEEDAPVDERGEQELVAKAHAFEAVLEGALEDARTDCASSPRHAAWRAAGTSPGWGPACARERRTRASRRPRLPPAAQTDTAPRRPGRTSAGRRCRYRWWRPAPARRSARRLRGWRRGVRGLPRDSA